MLANRVKTVQEHLRYLSLPIITVAILVATGGKYRGLFKRASTTLNLRGTQESGLLQQLVLISVSYKCRPSYRSTLCQSRLGHASAE